MNSRDRILGRLRGRTVNPLPAPDATSRAAEAPLEELLQAFSERMRAVKGEVMIGHRDELPRLLADWLAAAGAHRLVCGLDPRLDGLLRGLPESVEILRFDRPFEALSRQLIESVDVGLSHCDGAVAETGSLVFDSAQGQPRAVSLVPPLHVALLPLSRLYADLDALFAQWSADGTAQPTNRVLVSGPSKSADIEQVLAYGVHGPKRLLTLVYEDGE